MLTGGNRGICIWTRPGDTLSISNPVYSTLRSKRSLRSSNKQLEWQFYTLIYLAIFCQLQINKTSNKNARYMNKSPASVWKKNRNRFYFITCLEEWKTQPKEISVLTKGFQTEKRKFNSRPVDQHWNFARLLSFDQQGIGQILRLNP